MLMILRVGLNLKAAVEREKAVQTIDVHRECNNCVVTFWVMSQLLHFLGASRGCADFRDPTAVFRLKQITTDHIKGSLGSTKFNLSTISPKLASL